MDAIIIVFVTLQHDLYKNASHHVTGSQVLVIALTCILDLR